MSGFTYTDEQRAAIFTRDTDLLVAAGAGSGKTTVLVERILSRLREGGDIRRLLALTFTNAAAADMRRKLDAELARLLAAEPGQQSLRRAAALLPLSGVSTLHSYCLELLRQFHYRLGLPPGFRVAAQDELAQLRQEVLADLLEEEYARPDSGLHALADAYGGGQDDSGLAELILRLHSFSLSRPDPTSWLDECLAAYAPKDCLDDYTFAQALCPEIDRQLRGALDAMERALQVEVSERWQAQLAEEQALIRSALGCGGLTARLDALAGMKFAALRKPGKKELEAGGPTLAAAVEESRAWRKQATDTVKELGKQLAGRTAQQYLDELAALQPQLAELVRLTRRYGERLDAEKSRRLLVDFSDMEHLTLRLLEQDDLRQQLQSSYDEVLVDEYQDINEVQEAILRRLAPPQGLFAVGDVKQSIYRFRLAEPGLFLEKYRCFGQGAGGCRVDLNRNYRSDRLVLSGVNFIFRQLMVEQVAELDYDAAAQLYPGRDAVGAPPELHLIDLSCQPEGEKLSGLAAEGRYIAARIRDLHEQGCAYSDMAVLLRSGQQWQQTVAAALRQANIPVACDGDTSRPDSPERLLALALLQVTDDPLQDIPLAAALRSPLFGWNADQLVSLRLLDRDAELYVLLEQAASGAGELAELSRRFVAQLGQWRRIAAEQRVSDLLLDIYHRCGLLQLVGAMPDGAARQRELHRLLDEAFAYEGASYAGLFRFIRLLLEGESVSPAAAAVGEAVRIMTIHKSKGLEFPVVFVAGLSGRFNEKDQQPDVIWERSLGLGARVADRKQRVKYPALSHLAVAGRLSSLARAEEMRVLYVALTRARQRLILTASVKNAAAEVSGWALACGSGPTLPVSLLNDASAPLGWLGPALLRHPQAQALRALSQVSVPPALPDDGAWDISLLPVLPRHTDAEQAAPPPAPVDAQLQQQVDAALDWRYAQADVCALPAKWSVSSLARLHAEEAEDESQLAASAADDADGTAEVSPPDPSAARRAAERGTALHRAMELLDLRAVSAGQLSEQLDELCARGLLSAEQLTAADRRVLVRWFATEQGQALAHAELARRETPFTLLLPMQGEQVLVQGVIDAAYATPQGWVVLDFKTGGRALSDEQLKDKYRAQLEYYLQAVQRLWGAPVAGAYLCMLDQGRNIRL